MDFSNFFTRANSEYIEQLYSQYLEDPNSVEENWRLFFAGFEIGLGRPLPATGGDGEFAQLSQRRSDGTGDLVHSYRSLGHVVAKLDPLGNHRPMHPLLNITEFGFSSSSDLDRKVGPGGFLGPADGTLRDLLEKLQATYCGSIGVEFMDIPDKEQRTWILDRIEPDLNRPKLSSDEKKKILEQLVAAEEFEQFIHTKFIGQKRFSVEGGEAVIPLLDSLIETGAELGVDQIVMGMAHRGRLNVLAHIMRKPYELTFSEFEGKYKHDEAEGDGDVKYHKGFSNDRETASGRVVHCSLCPNPSHLELVDPVVEGVVRAKQEAVGDTNQTRVVPILVHGEAAFVGQGIVPETLNLSELESYRTGGTIHVIINNQVGFTATAQQTRFTPYPTDVAKMIHAPIFHVNGDDPEAIVHAARLAIGFRQQFKVDVMIDVWCYRKYGHNETDDPTFTQPLMYARIDEKVSVTQMYAKRLVEEGVISAADADAMRAEARQKMETSLQIAREHSPKESVFGFGGLWKGLTRAGQDWGADTRISAETIGKIIHGVTTLPEDFTIHRKLAKLYELRKEMSEGKRQVDWGTAEMWALGSLLMGGTPVRLTGQDCERGTFSHRHSVLHDTQTGTTFVPLAHLAEKQGSFTVVNTMLSELAVLGFEFGFSMASPRTLVMWEAQFGDFVNGAQPIIDQFISSSESKWQRMSGIVMLLPHGYEGQGPEHSSGRLERFLQLCAENNIQVCYPTLPAQYFHLLRRQMLRSFRKPLVLMMPKSLLRDERSSSRLTEFTDGSFFPLMDEGDEIDRGKVTRIVLCTGKVYFTLDQKRVKEGFGDTAILRIEQLYPFPAKEIAAAVATYPKAKEVVWVQEEPKNMGAWFFVEPRLREILSDRFPSVRYCGRDEAASPAVGSYKWHGAEEELFTSEAFAGSKAAVETNRATAESGK